MYDPNMPTSFARRDDEQPIDNEGDSSRDQEIREVLEGLRTDECWCTKIDGHTPACLATQALWNKVQND